MLWAWYLHLVSHDFFFTVFGLEGNKLAALSCSALAHSNHYISDKLHMEGNAHIGAST